ncbi:PEGA domain-containing protein, partial [candidate division CSSED10-310 bacterium]
KCFKGESDFSILFKIKSAQIDPVTELNPEIPEKISMIVLKALAQNREDRYQVCEEMANDIERHLSSENLMPHDTDISLFMRQMEEEFRAEMGDFEEYFPEQGEEIQGEVFELGADGRIPEEIGTRIAEEHLSIDSGGVDPAGDMAIDYGTQVVQTPLVQTAPRNTLNWLIPLSITLILILSLGGYLLYSGKLSYLFGGDTFIPTSGQTGNTKNTASNEIPFAIKIQSDPSPATVLVNGVPRDEKTPLTLKARGKIGDNVVISVTKDCFNSEKETIQLVKGKIPRELSFKLQRIANTVVVTSVPPGAKLYLDEKELGTTPYTMEGVDPCNEHSLKLVKADYETFSLANVFFKESNISYSMKKKKIPGYVSITSTYPVSIQNRKREIGKCSGPGLTLKLIEGVYNLEAINADYCIRHAFIVTITARKTNSVKLTFGPLGYVRIISNPYSEVTVNDFPLGTTPIQKLTLPQGSYSVIWNFVTLGKKKTEQLKVRGGIRQQWSGSMSF